MDGTQRMGLSWATVIATALVSGCSSHPPAASPTPTPAPALLAIDPVPGSHRHNKGEGGDEHLFSTYTIHDPKGRPTPGAIVRWKVTSTHPERLIMPPPVRQAAADANGQWTLEWVFNPQGPLNQVVACAAPSGATCEPAQTLYQVTVRVDVIGPIKRGP